MELSSLEKFVKCLASALVAVSLACMIVLVCVFTYVGVANMIGMIP